MLERLSTANKVVLIVLGALAYAVMVAFAVMFLRYTKTLVCARGGP